MPIFRCPRCTHRPLRGDEAACPECALDLDQVRADAALLMQPSVNWRPPAPRARPAQIRKVTEVLDAEPEPIEGAVRDCPTCGGSFCYTERRALAGGTAAAGWFCGCGTQAIERFV